MNYYPYEGYQPRRSGTGGGCGCGCNGGAGGVNRGPYTMANQPNYHMPIANQPMYQPMAYEQPMMKKPIEGPTAPQAVLKLLEEAVAGEKNDRIFYQQLIDLAPTKTEKDIIAVIRDDELAHFAQFRLIYRELSGKEISAQNATSPEEQPLSYMANLRQALFGEMAAVKKYRMIRAELTSKRHRDILFDIITDEFIHVGKYNFLITLNKRS